MSDLDLVTTQKTVYRCSDGMVFDDELEALQHQAVLRLDNIANGAGGPAYDFDRREFLLALVRQPNRVLPIFEALVAAQKARA